MVTDTPNKLKGLLLTHAKSTVVLRREAGIQEGRLFLSCVSAGETRPLTGDVAGGETVKVSPGPSIHSAIGQKLSQDGPLLPPSGAEKWLSGEQNMSLVHPPIESAPPEWEPGLYTFKLPQ